jgi:hypothetical protein
MHKFNMSFVFDSYNLKLTSWTWDSPGIEGLKFESPSKWISYEGFNLETWIKTESLQYLPHFFLPHCLGSVITESLQYLPHFSCHIVFAHWLFIMYAILEAWWNNVLCVLLISKKRFIFTYLLGDKVAEGDWAEIMFHKVTIMDMILQGCIKCSYAVNVNS